MSLLAPAVAAAWLAAFALADSASAQISSFSCPLPSPPNATCGNPEFESCGIDVGGVTRHVCVHASRQPNQALPAVWGFHGRTGDGAVAAGWMQDMTEQGMLLVAPSALDSGAPCVPAWRHLGSQRADWTVLDTGQDACTTAASTDNDADLALVQTLLDEIDSQIADVDHYAFGFSNGAGFTYQLMITAPLSARFDGFAMVANAMNEAKFTGATGGGAGPWSAELERTHPVLVYQGSADRIFVPMERMMMRTQELVTAAAAGAPQLQGGPCDMGGALTVEGVFACWRSQPMAPGLRDNTYVDRGLRTRLWLLDRNQPFPRPRESLYPDLGHGRDTTLREEDATVTVRREWPARRRAGSQPVVWLNAVDAAHTMAGARGGYPPCPTRNCDIDLVEEILQFWRANAGLRSLWR